MCLFITAPLQRIIPGQDIYTRWLFVEKRSNIHGVGDNKIVTIASNCSAYQVPKTNPSCVSIDQLAPLQTLENARAHTHCVLAAFQHSGISLPL